MVTEGSLVYQELLTFNKSIEGELIPFGHVESVVCVVILSALLGLVCEPKLNRIWS